MSQLPPSNATTPPTVIPFSFEGQEVRVFDQKGEPWWILADVCRILEIANPRDAASRLDEDEKMTVGNADAHAGQRGGPQFFNVVNESGLYSLVLTSRKPAAKRFKKWITAEVIPSIRKTGGYGRRDPVEVLNDPAAMRGLLLTYSEKVIALQQENAALCPKAEALDRIASTEGSFCITDAAKTLQIRPKVLFQFLRSHRWIYSRGAGGEVAFQDKLAYGLLEHKTTTVERSDGSEKTVTQVRVTPKGLTRLAKELAPVAQLVA